MVLVSMFDTSHYVRLIFDPRIQNPLRWIKFSSDRLAFMLIKSVDYETTPCLARAGIEPVGPPDRVARLRFN